MRSIDISWFELMQKSVSVCIFAILHSEASRIALWSRMATQKPTLICNYNIKPAILTDGKLNVDVAYPYGRLPLHYPWLQMNFARIPECQE